MFIADFLLADPDAMDRFTRALQGHGVAEAIVTVCITLDYGAVISGAEWCPHHDHPIEQSQLASGGCGYCPIN
jgi:hypothetical protein